MASRPTRQHVNIRVPAFRRCVSQKTGYATREEAVTAAERSMEMGKVSPGCHLTPYTCDECGEWHFYNKRIVFVEDGRSKRRR